MTLTTSKSSTLRIMRDPYIYEKRNCAPTNDSLMSPPLTPTELHHPTTTAATSSATSVCQEEEEEMQSWYYNNKREESIATPTKSRKEFITSYSKMVPFLRNSVNDNNNRSIFALNVYRDLILSNNDKLAANSKEESTRNISSNFSNSNYNNCSSSSSSSKINNDHDTTKKRKENDCAMLDKTVVSHSRKRNLSFSSSFNSDEEVEEYFQEDKKKTHKRKRVSSVLPTGKEAAIAFDSIDIDTKDEEFYPNGWVPFKLALDQVPVKVYWKGAPLAIHNQAYYDHLHQVEASMASILRLSPIQYLRCKRTLILAAHTLKLQEIPFTKSVAQKLCRVDVNKTSALWTAFGQLGWFNESHA